MKNTKNERYCKMKEREEERISEGTGKCICYSRERWRINERKNKSYKGKSKYVRTIIA